MIIESDNNCMNSWL